MVSTVAQACNGGLAAVPPAGSRAEPLVRGPLKPKAFALFGIQWNGNTCPISVFCRPYFMCSVGISIRLHI